MLLGDFNARVGRPVSMFGEDACNASGDTCRLISFLNEVDRRRLEPIT